MTEWEVKVEDDFQTEGCPSGGAMGRDRRVRRIGPNEAQDARQAPMTIRAFVPATSSSEFNLRAFTVPRHHDVPPGSLDPWRGTLGRNVEDGYHQAYGLQFEGDTNPVAESRWIAPSQSHILSALGMARKPLRRVILARGRVGRLRIPQSLSRRWKAKRLGVGPKPVGISPLQGLDRLRACYFRV